MDDEQWCDIYVALNGVGLESMQGKFDAMFGMKEEVVVEEGSHDAEYEGCEK